MKKIMKYVSIILLSVFLIVTVLCFPQFYYFDHQLIYKNFNLYSDKPFPQKTYSIMDKVEMLIQKSEIYDPHLHFKIFIRSDYSVHNLLPWQFSTSAYAVTRPLIKNVFISKGDFKSNASYKVSGGSRPLNIIIAHELVHVLVENKFLLQIGQYAEDWSKAGFLWKEEGYAEFIAGGSTFDLKQGLHILQHQDRVKFNFYELEYFKYWLAVSYLFEVKHITIKELMESRLSLENVLNEAILKKHAMIQALTQVSRT